MKTDNSWTGQQSNSRNQYEYPHLHDSSLFQESLKLTPQLDPKSRERKIYTCFAYAFDFPLITKTTLSVSALR